MTQGRLLDITEFGAVPDGETLCSKAFQEAMKVCAVNGGGTVYVPAGKFLTGPIHFVSNVTLHLDAGTRLLFSQNPHDYPIVTTRWEGAEEQVYSPQFFGTGLENVSITGRGVIDGQGESWWRGFRDKTLAYPRPRLIGFENCNNVLIEGVTLTNSPAWTVNPVRCENVTIHRITINNPADSPNTDGINPDSCRYVHISNCHVSVGDDCITIKSGTEDSSYRVPCENITITNCTMIHGHGGVVIGSEMSGGVRNVVISNCVFEGTDRGIRFKSRRGRGGVVEDIRVNNIVMKKVISPFVMHLYYHCGKGGKEQVVWDKNPHPVTETTPIFRRIHFSNITAREVGAAAGFLYGLPEMPIEDITFDNIEVHMADNVEPDVPAMMTNLEPMAGKGFYCCNVKNVSFNGVQISGQEGPGFTVEQGSKISFARCTAEDNGSGVPVIYLQGVQQAQITAGVAEPGQTYLEKGTDVTDVELIGG